VRVLLGVVVPLTVAYFLGGWLKELEAPLSLSALAGVLLGVAYVHTFRPFRPRR
jgi:hypothetical protein